MATRIPRVGELYGGDPALCDGNTDAYNPYGRPKPGKLASRHEEFVKAMTAATAEGVSGNVAQIPTDTGVPLIKSRKRMAAEMKSALDNSAGGSMAKGASDEAMSVLKDFRGIHR